ncbi:MAG: hypothetical protein R6W82_03640 [bacterium]
MPQQPYSQTPPGGDAPEEGLPMGAGLRILMGIGFLAVGIVQGVGILTAEGMGGTAAVIDGLGFFLLAGTGVTMLMDRAYSLYLLLTWSILGIVGTFFKQTPVVVPALIAQIMVGLVAIAALGQKGARKRAVRG